MEISPLQPAKLINTTANSEKTNSGFEMIFKNALNEVNQVQLDADNQAVAFSMGNPNVDIHDVMISMEQAQLALSLTIEIRNKLVESYQEIMRMQV